MSHAFGVKLKSTKTGAKLKQGHDIVETQDVLQSQKRLSQNVNVERNLGELRMSLKNVPARKPKLPVRTSSRKYKLACRTAPFYISKSPTFGVVLRPVKRNGNVMTPAEKKATNKGTTTPLAVAPENETVNDEKEHMYDLRFKDVPEMDGQDKSADDKSSKSKKTDEKEETPPGAPFGVRLKPTRTVYKDQPPKHRIYQIDLSPPDAKEMKETGGNSYQSQSKSFLEIKLKPMTSKSNSGDKNVDDAREGSELKQFVELQLRHVVAPEDGGPKRTVTEASFQIPFLKHVDARDLLLQEQKSVHPEGYHPSGDPFLDLLLMTIENLLPTTQNAKGEFGEQLLQIRLRHVDPKTGEITDFGQTIQVKLRSRPEEKKKEGGVMPASMQVSLKRVEPNDKTVPTQETPDFAKIRLQHVDVVDYPHGELGLDGEFEPDEANDISDEEEMVDESMRIGDDAVELAPEKCQSLRSSMPEINVGETEPDLIVGEDDENTEPSTDQDDAACDQSEKEEVIEDELDTDNEGKKKRRGRRVEINTKQGESDDGGVEPRRRRPQRTRSSSLTDLDRMKARRDHWVTVKAKELEQRKETKELTIKQKRDLLMWYNRMKCPNMQRMKARVALLPRSCDITPEDVELLPWRCKGRYLDIRVMNEYFLEDWEGAKAEKVDGEDDDESGNNNV